MHFYLILAGSVLSIIGVILLIWSSNLIQEGLPFNSPQGRELYQELLVIQILAALFVVAGNAALMYGAFKSSILSGKQEITRQ